ncbi:MAG: hypothetical protein VX278_13545 [Myxococcota bacterium]|nr:hypothetical protein [Myxococcota bacterium]
MFLSLLLACNLGSFSEVAENAVQTTSVKPQGEMKIFVLNDGTTVKGVLLGSNGEGFQVQTESLGTITIRTSELSEIQDPSQVSPKTVSNQNRSYQQEEQPSSVSSLKERLIPSKQDSIDVGNLMPKGLQERSISQIQEMIMQDPELMKDLYQLQNDPAFMEILTDPELTQLLKKGDMKALERHPKMKKLMRNPAMQKVIKKMMGK